VFKPGEIMKVLFVGLLLFTNFAFANPALEVATPTGVAEEHCSITNDIGGTSYGASNISVSEANHVLTVNMTVSFLLCQSVGGNFGYAPSLPYDPIHRVIDGVPADYTVQNELAVVVDPDLDAEYDLTASKTTSQNFSFPVDTRAVDQQLATMKAGQTLTKTYYFNMRTTALNSLGQTIQSVGSTYELDVTWTK